VFSLEMTEEQLSGRAGCYFSGVSLKRTVDHALGAEEILAQESRASLLEGIPLHVLYERDLTAQQICALAHSHNARCPLSLVVIDHLQIINTQASGKKYENRNIALGEATRLFKVLAGRLGCPVIALSQFSRDFDKTGAKLPRLSDLRDSGNIEQDADCVTLMHRLLDGSGDRSLSETDVIVAKNRSGPCGAVKLHFNAKTARFHDAP
jgi:replicative DNA helicase